MYELDRKIASLNEARKKIIEVLDWFYNIDLGFEGDLEKAVEPIDNALLVLNKIRNKGLFYYENFLRDLINRGVNIEGYNNVLVYIIKNDDLMPAIDRAVTYIYDRLPDADVSLRLYTDPEIEDSYLEIGDRGNNYDGEYLSEIFNVIEDNLLDEFDIVGRLTLNPFFG